MDAGRVVRRWRLLLPESCEDVRATHDAAPPRSHAILPFRVANGHLPAPTEPGSEHRLPDGEPSLEREAKRLGFDESVSLGWPDGERALIFEMDVPRKVARRLRVSGPPGLTWALFEPGVDGCWRPRSTASAAGYAGGASHVKLSAGRLGTRAISRFRRGAGWPGRDGLRRRRCEGGSLAVSRPCARAASLRGRNARARRRALTRRGGAHLPDYRECLDHVGDGADRCGLPDVPGGVHGQHAVALLLQHAHPARGAVAPVAHLR